ncbi:NADP-dependent malic enzyme [bacterium]|nr:NADP-dependent malic enzyme [bacterium]
MSDEKISREQLIAKSEKPGKDAMKLHPFYQGKIQITSKCVVRNMDDFAIWYTPGVAKPCLAIKDDPLSVYEHTNKGNFVAVVSDGTRVLGLGDIGPEAGLPVMEGKALLFKYLGGVDAFPIMVDTKDPDEIIDFVLKLQPTFGGVNLEDLSQPKCFYILEELRKKAHIPVWHDDQQGTAAVTVAGLINAVKVVNKKLEDVKVAMVGVGASNVRIAHQLFLAGVNPKNVIMCDSKGTLHTEREDAEILATKFKEKWELAQMTNPEKVRGGIPEAMKDADVLIALSKPGPGVILPEWVKLMASKAIVFACANPVPEIYPWDAKEAGATIVATGRSDFPNQVNNSLGFPGIFRGTLDVRAKTITDEMCLAAARELAKVAEDNGIHEDYIIPTMEEWEVFPREAAAVGMKAVEQGVAQITRTRDELLKMAEEKISNARNVIQFLMNEKFIPPAPED